MFLQSTGIRFPRRFPLWGEPPYLLLAWLGGLALALSGEVCWAQPSASLGSNDNPYRVFFSVEEADALIHVSKTGFVVPYEEYIIPKGALGGALTISGQVVSETEAGSNPIFEATVVVIHFITGQMKETLTDANGRFTVDFGRSRETSRETYPANVSRSGRGRPSGPSSISVAPHPEITHKRFLIQELEQGRWVNSEDEMYSLMLPPSQIPFIKEDTITAFVNECLKHFEEDPEDPEEKPDLIQPGDQPNLHLRLAGIERLITCEEYAKSSIMALEEITSELREAIGAVLSLQFLMEAAIFFSIDGKIREQAGQMIGGEEVLKRVEKYQKNKIQIFIGKNFRGWNRKMYRPLQQENYALLERFRQNKKLRQLWQVAILEEFRNYLPGAAEPFHAFFDLREGYRQTIQTGIDQSHDFISAWLFRPERQELAERYRGEAEAEMRAWKESKLVTIRQWLTDFASEVDTQAANASAALYLASAAAANPVAASWGLFASRVSAAAKGVKLTLMLAKIPQMYLIRREAENIYRQGVARILITPEPPGRTPWPIDEKGSRATRSTLRPHFISRQQEDLLLLLAELSASVAAGDPQVGNLGSQVLDRIEESEGPNHVVEAQASALLSLSPHYPNGQVLAAGAEELLNSLYDLGVERLTFASLSQAFFLAPEAVRSDYLDQINALQTAQEQWQANQEAFYELLDQNPDLVLPPVLAIQTVNYPFQPTEGEVFSLEFEVVNCGGEPAENVVLDLDTAGEVMLHSAPTVTWPLMAPGEVQRATFQASTPWGISYPIVYFDASLTSDNGEDDVRNWEMSIRVDRVPEITNLEPPEGTTIATSSPSIRATMRDLATGLVTLFVDGVEVQATFSEDSVVSYTPVEQRLDNGTHVVRLSWIGEGSSRTAIWSFQVDTGLSSEAPQIENLVPAQGTVVTTDRPRIGCVLNSLQEGATWTLLLDGTQVLPSFDAATGRLSYTPDGTEAAPALTEGYHTATAQVTSGREKVVANWVFEVNTGGNG